LPLWLSQPIWQNWKKKQTGATFLLLGFFAQMQKIKIYLSFPPKKIFNFFFEIDFFRHVLTPDFGLVAFFKANFHCLDNF